MTELFCQKFKKEEAKPISKNCLFDSSKTCFNAAEHTFLIFFFIIVCALKLIFNSIISNDCAKFVEINQVGIYLVACRLMRYSI